MCQRAAFLRLLFWGHRGSVTLCIFHQPALILGGSIMPPVVGHVCTVSRWLPRLQSRSGPSSVYAFLVGLLHRGRSSTMGRHIVTFHSSWTPLLPPISSRVHRWPLCPMVGVMRIPPMFWVCSCTAIPYGRPPSAQILSPVPHVHVYRNHLCLVVTIPCYMRSECVCALSRCPPRLILWDRSWYLCFSLLAQGPLHILVLPLWTNWLFLIVWQWKRLRSACWGCDDIVWVSTLSIVHNT